MAAFDPWIPIHILGFNLRHVRAWLRWQGCWCIHRRKLWRRGRSALEIKRMDANPLRRCRMHFLLKLHIRANRRKTWEQLKIGSLQLDHWKGYFILWQLPNGRSYISYQLWHPSSVGGSHDGRCTSVDFNCQDYFHNYNLVHLPTLDHLSCDYMPRSIHFGDLMGVKFHVRDSESSLGCKGKDEYLDRRDNFKCQDGQMLRWRSHSHRKVLGVKLWGLWTWKSQSILLRSLLLLSEAVW